MAFKKLFLWRNLKKKSKLITDANIILDKLQYKSRYYDARPFRDLVLLKLQFNEYLEEISFPVQVQRKRMPILTYGRNDFLNFYAFLNKNILKFLWKIMKSGKEFKDRVTIVTKERNETGQVEGISLNHVIRGFKIHDWIISDLQTC